MGRCSKQVKIHPTSSPPSPPPYQIPPPPLPPLHPGNYLLAPSYQHDQLRGHIAKWFPWEGLDVQTFVDTDRRDGEETLLPPIFN